MNSNRHFSNDIYFQNLSNYLTKTLTQCIHMHIHTKTYIHMHILDTQMNKNVFKHQEIVKYSELDSLQEA